MITQTPPTAPSRHRGPGPVVLVVVGAVVLAALLAGVVALLSGSDDDGGTSTGGSSEAVEGGGPADGSADATGFDTAAGTVDGTPLPEFTGEDDDPAVGLPAPEVTGRQLDGSALTAPAPGRPTMMLFLAHWCPHCQAEVQDVVEWAETGGLPADVDLVAVATSITSARPNYPPSDWLAREGWDQPAIADASGAVGSAYGLTNLPYWVIVDEDGAVVERRAGTQSRSGIEDLAELARTG